MAFKNNHGAVKAPSKGTSAKTFMPVNSGSRPTTSKHGIETSAPKEPHKLGRTSGNHLK